MLGTGYSTGTCKTRQYRNANRNRSKNKNRNESKNNKRQNMQGHGRGMREQRQVRLGLDRLCNTEFVHTGNMCTCRYLQIFTNTYLPEINL